MIPEIFSNYLEGKKTTLLAVGPMSKNCVDATIELSNRYNTPIMLIASRRQIDSEDFGGGYVNNWTTKQFSEYVDGKAVIKRETSDKFFSGLFEVPENITSSMPAPLILLADVSPMHHLKDSTIFDFPQPFGPTIPVKPSSM